MKTHENHAAAELKPSVWEIARSLPKMKELVTSGGGGSEKGGKALPCLGST